MAGWHRNGVSESLLGEAEGAFWKAECPKAFTLDVLNEQLPAAELDQRGLHCPNIVAKDFFGSSAHGGMAPKSFGPAPILAYLRWIVPRRAEAGGGPRNPQEPPKK